MRARLFKIASGVSVLLSLLLGTVYVWSYFRWEQVNHKGAERYFSVWVVWGRVGFASMNQRQRDALRPPLLPPGRDWNHFGRNDPLGFKRMDDARIDRITSDWTWRWLGVWIGRPSVGQYQSLVFVSPLWPMILMLSVVPFSWLWQHEVAKARTRSGKCPVCGYELRATPDRCPECGTFPACNIPANTC